MNVIKKMLFLLTVKEKTHLLFIFSALVCMAFIEIAGIASIMPFMAVVANPEVIHTNKWLKTLYDYLGFETPQGFLFLLGLVVLGLLLFSNAFKAFTSWVMLRFDNKLNANISRRLLAVYLTKPYSFFLNRNTAEMGKNILSEVRTVIAGILSPGMQVLSSILTSLFILTLLVVLDPHLAVTIALVLGGTYAIIYSGARRKLSRIGQEQVMANAMKYKVAGEALSGIKDLKILGRERDFLGRFAKQANKHARNNIAAGVISQLPRYALESIAFGGILLIVLYYMGNDKGSVHMIPLLALYAFASYRLLPALQQIFVSITTIRFSLASLEVLHKDMQKITDAFDPEQFLAEKEKQPSLAFNHELVLRDISYAYPGTQEPAVDTTNLSIPANSTIGFVGATGSGKTTIVDLILGLLSPTNGYLLADGTRITEENLPRWQRNLGYVPQHIYLSDDTITRNIAFGVSEPGIDMNAVKRAASTANLHEFVEQELPHGYATEIGERGVRLSGGQRQRIGIARALYRDPAVLVMDEATSALDGITELAVMEALRSLSGDKTVIIIAHRLTTVKDCDVIYHMEHGRIVNQGSYDELLNSSSWFQAATRAGGKEQNGH